MTKVFFIVVVLLLLGEREGRLVRSQETFWAPAMLNKASGKDSAIKTEDVTDSNCRPDTVVWTCCILQGDGERLASCPLTRVLAKQRLEIFCPEWVPKQQTQGQDLLPVGLVLLKQVA